MTFRLKRSRPMKTSPATTAYSYLRFSSPAQAEGDSIRRQSAARDAWLARHPSVKLDTSLKLADEGVSAFKGDNRKHALGQFADLARRGRVPAGSFLLIENMDRLSREKPVRAVNMLTEILLAGVRVVQLQPAELELTEDSDLFELFKGQMEQGRGHSESRMKSERVGAAWGAKRSAARNGAPLGKMCPAWVEVIGQTKDARSRIDNPGTYRLRADAARTVRSIFAMSAAGLGVLRIVGRLIRDKVQPIGRTGWNRSYIHKMLADRAALGEYQPHKRRGGWRRIPDGEPIPNYFPAVVSEEVFHAAQRARTGRTGKSGRPAAGGVNPFSGLLVDAQSGDRLYISSTRGRRYFVPRGATESGAGWRSFPVTPLVDGLIGMLEEVAAAEIFADPHGSKVSELVGRLDAADKRLAVASAKWESDPDSTHWQGMVDKADRERRALAADLVDARREAANPKSAQWAETVALMRKDDPSRLRQALLSVISEVRCVFHANGGGYFWAAAQVFFKDSEQFRTYIFLHKRATGRAAGKRKSCWWSASTTQLPGERETRPFIGGDMRNLVEANAAAADLADMDPAAFIERLAEWSERERV
jgi:DNA invertase Pin-like site-specific DNA recombinase